MINKLSVFHVLFILISATFCLAQPNLKWFSTDITLAPANPVPGNTVTFSATLRCAREDADNVLVSVKVDGIQIWSNTYSHLVKSQDVQISTSWQATQGSHIILMEIDPNDTIAEYIENDNMLQKTFNVGGGIVIRTDLRRATINPATVLIRLPDLTITHKFISPTEPMHNQDVKFTMTVKNLGPASAPASKLKMTLLNTKTSTQKEFILDVVPLNKGYSVTVSKTIKLEAGYYMLNGVADYNNAIQEANENNNNAPTGFVTAALPDLVIEKLTCYPEEPEPGEKFFCIMNLTNKGIGKKGSAPHKIKLEFKNLAFFWSKKTYIIDWTYEIDNGSIWFPKQLEISLPIGKYRVEATADYKNQVHESNEGNNSITIDLKVKPKL